MWKTPTFSMPGTLRRMFTTRWPVSSSVARSLPMSLTEFAPLMPERASSMLSRMSCEKLKLSALEVPELRGELLLDLLAGHPLPPFLHRAKRHVEFEVEEAGDVGPVVGASDLGHHPPDLGDRGDDLAEPRGHPRGLLSGDGPGHQGPDPEVALLELGHELGPQPGQEGDGEGEQAAHDKQASPGGSEGRGSGRGR